MDKPRLEDVAADYLSGSNLTNLLDFAAWMRANKITPTFGSQSKIGVSYTSHVLYVKLFRGSWQIWISGKHRKYGSGYVDDFLACKQLKEIVGQNLPPCRETCKHNCNDGQGHTVVVGGKKYERICGCCTVRFCCPTAETLCVIKRVIENRSKL